MVCHHHDLHMLMTQDDVNGKTILLISEEYQDNFEEDDLPCKVCMDIKLCESWKMVSHQMLHSKQWLLGWPSTEFASYSSSSLSSSSSPLGYQYQCFHRAKRKKGRRKQPRKKAKGQLLDQLEVDFVQLEVYSIAEKSRHFEPRRLMTTILASQW